MQSIDFCMRMWDAKDKYLMVEFSEIQFYAKKIVANLNLPAAKRPFVFVCDDPFPLQDNLLKPYPGKH